MSTILSFKSLEYKHDVCGGKDWMKIFCEYLKAHTENNEFYKEKN